MKKVEKENTKKINYDANDNPIPYEIIDCITQEVYHNFVELHPTSVTRKNIFNGFTDYIIDLSNLLQVEWTQWLDGSFTTKKRNPKDIDLVNIVEHDKVNEVGDSIKPYLTRFGNCKDRYSVDGYLIVKPDSSNPHYSYFIRRYRYWKKWFGHDRNNNPKGIISVRNGVK